MIKRILVPLDTSEYTLAATRTAALLATAPGQEGATVTGLGLVDLDQLPTGRFASLVPRDAIIAEAQATVQGLVQTFRGRLREAGVPDARVRTREVSGSPFREIIRESVFNDLVVQGEQCSFPPVHHDYMTLRHLYHEASRPLLLTRNAHAHVETVLLAMDGTAPASRMLYTYVHLNPFPRARVLLVYAKAETERYRLGDFFPRVAAWLEEHGLTVESRAVQGALEEELPALVQAEHAQVLAVGVHRTGFLERLRDPLDIQPHLARRLLDATRASLFLVH